MKYYLLAFVVVILIALVGASISCAIWESNLPMWLKIILLK